MKYVRSLVALSLVLGLSALICNWPVLGQQPGALPQSRDVPDGINNPFGATPTAQMRDPAMAKVLSAETSADQEVRNLMHTYKRTEDADERGKIKTKLAAALAKQFDAQQKRRDLELSRVEAQLKKLRDLMKKRDEERKTIIDHRVDQLVRDADGLGWAPPPGPSSLNVGQNHWQRDALVPQR